MYRFRSILGYKTSIRGALTTAAVLPLVAAYSFCDETKEKENISLYLKPESQEVLNKYLADRGISGKEARLVCFSRNSSADHQYIYKPIYGQRAAFRLKGLVQTNDGVVVGVGRISTMVGEVKDDDFVASLPFFDADKATDVEKLLDIPTRVEQTKGSNANALWKGRLPAMNVRGTSHGAINGVTYTALPTNKQVVVEGYICSSRYVDQLGNCLYDRSLDEDENALLKADKANVDGTKKAGTTFQSTTSPLATTTTEEHVSTEQVPAESVTHTTTITTTIPTTTASTEEPAAEPAAECPICKYMKAGPCRDQFIAWDECVQGVAEDQLHTTCFKKTCNMMNCMKKYEYYDIMTAGTDFTRLDEAERAADEADAKTTDN